MNFVMFKKMSLVLVALTTLFVPGPSQGETVVFRGATLMTVSHGIFHDGTLIVRDGKIVAIGSKLSTPPGAVILDLPGKVIIPGLIDSRNQLGLIEIMQEKTTADNTENSGAIQARINVLDSLNPNSETIRVARSEGITQALITPDTSNLISGQSALINLNGSDSRKMAIKSPVALHVNLGADSRNRPSNTVGDLSASTTRMGSIALIRQTFLDALNYRYQWNAYEKLRGSIPPKRDLNLEVIVDALNGKIPVIITAHRESDLQAAIRLSEEFNFRLILANATEAYKICTELRRKRIPVILGPVLQGPQSTETKNARLDTAQLLSNSGVLVALQTDDVLRVRELPIQIEYLIGAGLSDEEALRMVTLNPAKMFGVEKSLGSLDVGKNADFVVLDGAPFHYQTHVESEYINGEKVDLSNHQTRLFEHYKQLYKL